MTPPKIDSPNAASTALKIDVEPHQSFSALSIAHRGLITGIEPSAIDEVAATGNAVQGTNLTYPDIEDMEELKNKTLCNEVDSIIRSTPDMVKEIVLKFDSNEERLMALYGIIVLAGSLMPNVTINYANRINYPALMLLIIFPPASGKGGLSLIRKLGSKINRELMSQHEDLLRDYQQKTYAYKKAVKSSAQLLPPAKPKLPLFIVPGNITSAKLIEQLNHNGPDQFLTVFETEADAFGISASNSQHGDMLSTIVRQAYHFETISQIRKTGSELHVAENPKLAMILSGTDNQVSKIFSSNEDGMISRFLTICGNASATWKNVKPDLASRPLDHYFEKQSEEFFKIWQFFKTNNIEVKFTDPQWDRINDFGARYLAITHEFTAEITGSFAKRHANMLTRIAAVLTAIRYYNLNNTPSEIYCWDADFKTAYWMVEKSLSWCLELYKKLPNKKGSSLAGIKLKFFEALPNQFKFDESRNYFPGVVPSDRTFNRMMKSFVETGLLNKLHLGQYEKTSMSQLALAHFKEDQQKS